MYLKWCFLLSHLQTHACIEPISSAQGTVLVEEGDHYELAPIDPSTKQADNIKGQHVMCCEVAVKMHIIIAQYAMMHLNRDFPRISY